MKFLVEWRELSRLAVGSCVDVKVFGNFAGAVLVVERFALAGFVLHLLKLRSPPGRLGYC